MSKPFLADTFDVARLNDEEGLLVLEPRADFDACIIGIVERFNQRFVLYSKRKVIEVHLKGGMGYEEVIEHYGFNMNGGWYGDETWGFLDDLDDLVVEHVEGDQPEPQRRLLRWHRSGEPGNFAYEGVDADDSVAAEVWRTEHRWAWYAALTADKTVQGVTRTKGEAQTAAQAALGKA